MAVGMQSMPVPRNVKHKKCESRQHKFTSKTNSIRRQRSNLWEEHDALSSFKSEVILWRLKKHSQTSWKTCFKTDSRLWLFEKKKKQTAQIFQLQIHPSPRESKHKMLTGNSINGAGDWEKTQVELFSESQQQKVTSQKYREDDQGLLVVKKELIMKFRKGTVIQHHTSLNFQGN